MPNMTRRNLIIGLATVLSLTVLGAIPATSADLGLDGLTRIMSGNNKVTVMEGPVHTSDDRTYRFLGSDEFLQAAQTAGVRTIANEVPQEFQPQVTALQNAVVGGDTSAIDQARGALRTDFQTLSATSGDAATASREKEFMMDYVEKAARYGIEIVFADTIATDAQANALARQYRDALSQYNQASPGSPQQAQLENRALTLSNALGVERFSEAVNRRIAQALAGMQQARQGNMVVVFGAGHGDSLEGLFRQAGYTTAKVALHASAAGMKADRQVAASAGFSYSGDAVLMDTETFIAADPSLFLFPRQEVNILGLSPR